MDTTNKHSVRRLGAFMYGLIGFIQENAGLVSESDPPIRFLPQLLPQFRQEGPLRDIRQAVTDAKPYPEKVALFQVWVSWDESSRTLTFSAPPEAAAAVTPRVIDLSNEHLDTLADGPPAIELRDPKPGEPSYIFEGDLPESAAA